MRATTGARRPDPIQAAGTGCMSASFFVSAIGGLPMLGHLLEGRRGRLGATRGGDARRR
jgi:hypothetical protein